MKYVNIFCIPVVSIVIYTIAYYFRWHKCTVITQKAFNAKVSQMYVAAHKGMETRSLTSKMIDNLKASFRTLLEAADWMDAGMTYLLVVIV